MCAECGAKQAVDDVVGRANDVADEVVVALTLLQLDAV
jgi:hypothetical protein